MSKNRLASDTIAMAAVKVLSLCSGLVTTMILSRLLPLTDYGTYSTGNLITATATSLCAFGLMDAVNFYYNGKPGDQREGYINTAFALIFLCGLAAAAVILAGSGLITEYFHNPRLAAIYIYVAFRPLISNLELGTRNLHLSIGRAKFIALRNGLFSGGKLVLVGLAALLGAGVETIFACILALEAATLVFNYTALERSGVAVRPHRLNTGLIREILAFCVPMGIYIQTNALSQNLDSFVIGYFEPTERLAIYTNCASRLPIDFVSNALMTVLIPALTRAVHRRELARGRELFRSYIKIGYLFAWPIGGACIVLAPQVVRFLYGERYLDGTAIFVIYMVVDMIRFANLSLILSAKGETKRLMWISMGSLAANLILNYGFYHLFGFAGPALATVVVMAATTVVVMGCSARILGGSMVRLVDWRHLAQMLAQLVAVGAVTFGLRRFLEGLGLHYFLILAVCGGGMALVVMAMNHRQIREAFGLLNRSGKENV